MTRDVSNTAIVILLVLTILIALTGTWTVLETAKQARQLQYQKTIPIQSQAQTSDFDIPFLPPPPGKTDLAGNVALTIVQ